MKYFEELMFDLDDPLGWGDDLKNYPERREKRKSMVYDGPKQLEIQINDFLDKIVVLYVIRKEV